MQPCSKSAMSSEGPQYRTIRILETFRESNRGTCGVSEPRYLLNYSKSEEPSSLTLISLHDNEGKKCDAKLGILIKYLIRKNFQLCYIRHRTDFILIETSSATARIIC